jgi:uncharacterized membrane protein
VLYEVLLFVHIVAATVWVGGAITIHVLASRAVRSGDPARIATMSREAGFVGQRIIAPTSVVLLAMGLSMVAVSDAWTIGQAWIIIALVIFGATFLAGILFFGPEGGRVEKAIAERGADDPEVHRRLRRIMAVSRIDLVLLLLVLADMVFKPGL